MRMSRAPSLALAFNFPKLFSLSPPFFSRLRLDSLYNTNRQSDLSNPNYPSLPSVFEFNSPSPACPLLSPAFRSSQVPSSPFQDSAFSHSLSAVHKKRMQLRHRMQSRWGGGGRGDGGCSSSGSSPSLSAMDEAYIQPSACNVASFIFRSELNRPRVTTTITVAFQEEASDEVRKSFGARKRQSKSTILVKPPQVARKEIALPAKIGSETFGSDNSSSPTSGSDNSGREDTALKSSYSPSSSDFSTHNSKEKAGDPDEGYNCPIMEENPPHSDS